MSLSHKRTPVLRMKQEESPTKALNNLPNWENFKCEAHPQLQIQALGFNKSNKNFALVCIKCIIEGDYFKTGGEDESITIKDLLDSYSKTLSSYRKTPLKNKEALQEKFMSFLIKDYMGTYERHLEAQSEKVDHEIVEVIEMLTKLRDKYKQYYNSELELVRDQASEMKSKINKLLENTKDQEGISYSSMTDVYAQMAKISEHDELLDFLRELYHKSKEQSDDASYGDDCRKLLANMDSFKEKALTCKTKDVQLSAFEDMKESLQNFLQTESSAFRKSVEGIKPGKPSKKEMEVEPKRDFESRLEARREAELRREHDLKREPDYRREVEYRRESDYKRDYEPRREIETRRKEVPSKKYQELDSDFEAENEEMDSQIYHSPAARDERSSSAKRRNFDNFSTAKKSNVRRERHTDIGSQSLRNLRRELEKRDDEDDGKNKGNIIASLHDWINRRITGYLVFQNTMNSDPEGLKDKGGISETGVHLNHSMGRRWKALSESEREEYKKLAIDYRKRFKQEIEEYDDSEKADDLLEMLDAKIKKIKRE